MEWVTFLIQTGSNDVLMPKVAKLLFDSLERGPVNYVNLAGVVASASIALVLLYVARYRDVFLIGAGSNDRFPL